MQIQFKLIWRSSEQSFGENAKETRRADVSEWWKRTNWLNRGFLDPLTVHADEKGWVGALFQIIQNKPIAD